MRLVAWMMLGLVASGCCCKNQSEMTRYHDDGRAKPVVLVAPMIDTSSFDAPWSISEELTSLVVDRFSSSGVVYVAASEDVAFTDNPFGQDLSWMKREFSDREFVVFLELVEHESVPADPSKRDLPPQEVSTYLNSCVRMRVVDLRGPSPKIVLQEMVRDSYFVAKTLLPTNYNLVGWGSAEYEETPMKAAHDQLANEIAVRVTDYILLAKSR